jgi:hypothetical protein
MRQALWPFLGLIFTWMFATGAVISLWPVYMSTIGYSQMAIGGLWGFAALGEAPCMILAGHLAACLACYEAARSGAIVQL